MSSDQLAAGRPQFGRQKQNKSCGSIQAWQTSARRGTFSSDITIKLTKRAENEVEPNESAIRVIEGAPSQREQPVDEKQAYKLPS